jgi:hypothetical protein
MINHSPLTNEWFTWSAYHIVPSHSAQNQKHFAVKKSRFSTKKYQVDSSMPKYDINIKKDVKNNKINTFYTIMSSKLLTATGVKSFTVCAAFFHSSKPVFQLNPQTNCI